MLTASALSVISKPTTPFMLCSEQAACHSICPVLSPFGCFQQCLRPINKEQGIPVMLRALWLPFLPERLITRTNIFNSRLPPPATSTQRDASRRSPKGIHFISALRFWARPFSEEWLTTQISFILNACHWFYFSEDKQGTYKAEVSPTLSCALGRSCPKCSGGASACASSIEGSMRSPHLCAASQQPCSPRQRWPTLKATQITRFPPSLALNWQIH